MIKFEKVSYKQFKEDILKHTSITEECEIQTLYKNVQIPKRATHGSAGYDFVSPISAIINDAHSPIIPTGIRVQLSNNYVLLLMPRSGIGFATGTRLANTIGVIDSDYYYSKNEGHIMIKFSKGFKEKQINAGDRIAQGIFTLYLLTDDDEMTSKNVRDGGLGSSGE